jgi:hypothetical protein
MSPELDEAEPTQTSPPVPPREVTAPLVEWLKAIGRFDADWYLTQYPDVPDAHLEPQIRVGVTGQETLRAITSLEDLHAVTSLVTGADELLAVVKGAAKAVAERGNEIDALLARIHEVRAQTTAS